VTVSDNMVAWMDVVERYKIPMTSSLIADLTGLGVDFKDTTITKGNMEKLIKKVIKDKANAKLKIDELLMKHAKRDASSVLKIDKNSASK